MTTDVEDKLVVPVLLGTILIDKFTRSIHQAKEKIVPNHTLPVPTVMVQEAESEAEKDMSDIHQFIHQNQTLFVTPIRGKVKYITVARKLFFKAMCETPASASTQAAGPLNIISHENVSKNNACMPAREFMDAYAAHPFYPTVSSFGKADVHLPKH